MKQELYCENGKHKWKREAKRGRKPRNCPKHLDVAEAKPKVPKVVNLEKAREAKEAKAKLREQEDKESQRQHLEYLRERVKKASELEEKAHKKLMTRKTDKNLSEWLKFDGRLMAEITALRAKEAKVA